MLDKNTVVIILVPRGHAPFGVSTKNGDLWEGLGKVQFSEHAQSNGKKTLGTRLDGQNSVISK